MFCALPTIGMIECASAALDLGYKTENFVWSKPDLTGQSHVGGPHQATSIEYIVVVYKHAEVTELSLGKHYSLYAAKETFKVCLVVDVSLNLFFSILFCGIPNLCSSSLANIVTEKIDK